MTAKTRTTVAIRRVTLTGGIAAAMVSLLLPALPAAAAPVTVTFDYTGAAQTYTVPAGVTSIVVEAQGAQGGESFVPGGQGGRAVATVGVTSGEVLQVNVGGAGATANGGWNGGGASLGFGGGGGGASDIRRGAFALADRLVVAGGGGGSSNCSGVDGQSAGGAGGGALGANGDRCSIVEDHPGAGGTQSAGGAGGGAAGSGALGLGGAGADVAFGQGGGGGGGLYGGGGADGGGGAGGGSGFGPVGVAFTSGVRAGNGTVTISYEPAPVVITTTSLAGGTVGAAYSATIVATGGAPGGLTWSVTAGSLPAGLAINAATGAVTGTPTAAGTSTFTVTAADTSGNTGAHAFTVAVVAPLSAGADTALPPATAGGPVSFTVPTTGGAAPITFAVTSGSLPSGLSLDPATGAVTGTPTAAGNYTATIMATDRDGRTDTMVLTVSVAAALAPATPTPVPPSTLPATGSDAAGMLRLGLGLLVVGAAMTAFGSGVPERHPRRR